MGTREARASADVGAPLPRVRPAPDQDPETQALRMSGLAIDDVAPQTPVSAGAAAKIAETLREQTEPNIDELLAIVTESVAAYKVCQTRIDAVDKALKPVEQTMSMPPISATTDFRKAGSITFEPV